ncbi:type I restriction-modification system, M subunit [Leptospira santarosai str. CBC379]|uniref:site-specific DNA-methyltransferase (adenine-specific) n=1 Tax=Leptospira santarosai str. MOR084 TaxID=1049984 RepID=A0A0E2BCG3_9LEPT|nr:type I restriction-modification system subunit M [Leptospira santarosai]EKO33052.1 type I restriction-modification system, M subunit [Leptospira santarosai str. MOR084]EKR89638.1 type I restriction-modification system, M subunit [Leptospira santarosai str. CBC379]
MKSIVSQKEINDIVWKACDSFRGAIDPSEYKNYILTMLFIKYLTDLWKDKREEHSRKYSGDKERIERALSRERFIVPLESDFDFLYEQREAANIGELINRALQNIEEANKQKLENVFRNIDFNSEVALGQAKERNKRLQNLLKDFHNEKLDVRPSRIGNRDVIGDVYEYLIGKFASDAGKKAGEFYTPPEVSTLLAKLVQPKPGDKICDPACGSGSLLIKVAHEVGSEDYALFGQESNGSTWSLGRMNMFLHGMDSARIVWGNTIDNPRLIEKDNLMHFNIVVANPPFSLEKWGHENAEKDKYRRFWRGIPPKSRGDYAFISHMVETALVNEGKVGVIVPHGVLFRGGSEGTIRTKFIEENILEAVIGLPSQLFFGTGIPAAILIFNKGRKAWKKAKSIRDKHILFIDASREFDNGKKQNQLRDQDIQKIVKTFKSFEEIEKYSHRATLSEIQEAEFNLNIPRYVDTFEEEEEIDIKAVQKEIKSLESELAKTQKKLDGYLKELGLS